MTAAFTGVGFDGSKVCMLDDFAKRVQVASTSTLQLYPFMLSPKLLFGSTRLHASSHEVLTAEYYRTIIC